MEILAIIPARGGSKGIPHKNIKELCGHPLIYYSIKAGQDSKYVTRTVLSTEDELIKQKAIECGCEVIDRPMELAHDTTMTVPVMMHVLDELEKKENYIPDAVVLLQPTCPLRNAEKLDKFIKFYLDNLEKGFDSAFAVFKRGITHALWRQIPGKNEFEAMYDYRNRPRRQDTDRHYPMYGETGSGYICKTDVMRKVNDFIGEKPMLYVIDSCNDIDTLNDFEKVEQILSEQNKNE